MIFAAVIGLFYLSPNPTKVYLMHYLLLCMLFISNGFCHRKSFNQSPERIVFYFCIFGSLISSCFGIGVFSLGTN